ncbi:putative WRKY transcription factor 2 [Drosera capensis]
MMEDSECGLDMWRDIELSPGRMCSSYFSESCFAREDPPDVFRGGGEVDIDNDEARDGVEDAKLGFERGREELENGIVGEGVKSSGSIAERRGVNASKIRTSSPKFRTSSSLMSPGARSNFLMIPTGISPTMLLDSPIMVPNGQPSPTTGTLAKSDLAVDSTTVESASYHQDLDKGHEDDASLSFIPQAHAISLTCSSGNQVPCADNTAPNVGVEFDGNVMALVGSRAGFECATGEATINKYDSHSSVDVNDTNNVLVNENSSMQISDSNIVSGSEMSPDDEASRGEVAMDGRPMDWEQKGMFSSVGSFRTSDDGYNWRKYGQKQVKGSEYPWSYYKCTHLNCLVKKKIERSQDGQITEIVYKGAHNHPKPQLNRRATFGSVLSVNDSSEAVESSSSCVKAEDYGVFGSTQHKVGPDGLERTPSTSGVTEVSDPMSASQGKLVGVLDAAGTWELASTLASNEADEEDIGEDDEESKSIRRKKEEGSLVESFYGSSMSSRASHEPRVVVQVESDIDILDDGYRWRKYGQKVVKGNPNPRSYYKCTSAGCTVRKHVERASHDLKYVIMTYEGKHNHEVPVAKNSSHASPGGGNLLPTAPNTQATLALTCDSLLPKREHGYHSHDIDPILGYRFDVQWRNNLGSLGVERSSFYPIKYPPLPSAAPYDTLGMNPSHCDPNPSSIIPAAFAGGSIPSQFEIYGPSNIPLSNCSNRNSRLAFQSCFVGSEHIDEHRTLMIPKQEVTDNSAYDIGISNQASTSSSSPYQQMFRHFAS